MFRFAFLVSVTPHREIVQATLSWHVVRHPPEAVKGVKALHRDASWAPGAPAVVGGSTWFGNRIGSFGLPGLCGVCVARRTWLAVWSGAPGYSHGRGSSIVKCSLAQSVSNGEWAYGSLVLVDQSLKNTLSVEVAPFNRRARGVPLSPQCRERGWGEAPFCSGYLLAAGTGP